MKFNNNIGKNKWYNPDKGFGFIKPRDHGYDVFVHRTELQKINLDQLPKAQLEQLTLAYKVHADFKDRLYATNVEVVKTYGKQ